MLWIIEHESNRAKNRHFRIDLKLWLRWQEDAKRSSDNYKIILFGRWNQKTNKGAFETNLITPVPFLCLKIYIFFSNTGDMVNFYFIIGYEYLDHYMTHNVYQNFLYILGRTLWLFYL